MTKWLTTYMLLSFFAGIPLYAGWLAYDINVSDDPTADDLTSYNAAWCVAGVESTVHAVWYHQNQSGVQYCRSTNGGTVWTEKQTLGSNQQPSVAAVACTVHVVWSTGSRIIYKRNNSNGDSAGWASPCTLGLGARPCIAAQGKYVHVVWNSSCNLIYKRYDGGQWGAPRTIYNTGSTQKYAVVSVTGRYVYVVWAEPDDTGGIYFRRHTSWGDSLGWDSVIHLVNSSSAEHPSVAACRSILDSDSTAHVFVTWDDKDSNDNYQIFYKRSTNAGQNWENNVQLTTDSTDSRWSSVTAYGEKAHCVWCTAVQGSGWTVYYKKIPSSVGPISISDTNYEYYPTIDSYGDTLHVVWTSWRDTIQYDVYYNHYIPDTAMHPPVAPYISQVEKSTNHVVLTWNKVTADTMGYKSLIDYYVVYRDTLPDFVPDSTDSIGFSSQPETTFTDSSALSHPESYYYLVKAVDSYDNTSKASNMGYKLSKFFNENSRTTDRNWVSVPWHCNYDSATEIADDLSPVGVPLTKIANLRDDQLYESWLWDPEFGEWYGTDFAIVSGRGYEMINTNDTSLFLVGSNNPNGLVTLNENDSITDRNWVSIPYNAVYSTVSDITDEYSPSGNPLTKITNLRDDQLYESWIWDSLHEEWYGEDFVIERGRGYELITVVDTTWNPTEYSNEAKGFCIAENQKYRLRGEARCGRSSEPDRAPVWIFEKSVDDLSGNQVKPINVYLCADKYRLNPIVQAKAVDFENKLASDAEEQQGKGGIGNTLDEKISHVVRAYIIDGHTYSNIAFTTYRLNSPEDVLTENMIGSNTVTHVDLGALWFDVGNFETPWKGGEEAILIVEAIREGKPYIDVEYFKLDETVDIQGLGKISLEPSFNFGSQGNEPSVLKHEWTYDNIIGYSLYKNGKRINHRILEDECSIPPDVSVKLVIVGGHETVYGSDGIQKEPDKAMPISFAFAVVPNPFVKETRIDYALPKQASVNIVIYDVSGRRVKTIASEMQNAGYYSAIWNGSDDHGRQIASGVYFARFNAGEYRTHTKVLLVK